MLSVIKPGLLTSIQDLGRYGYQRYGVIVSGVMDSLSHRVANILIGNEENAATLEITMLGPELVFYEDAVISICGGVFYPTVDGEPVHLWRPIYVKRGSKLSIGQVAKGCRAYLAIGGGFYVPEVLNSQSTYLRANIGGFQGRALVAGDVLTVKLPNKASQHILQYLRKKAKGSSFSEMEWRVSLPFIPDYSEEQLISVMKGRQFDLFTREAQEAFYQESFKITPQSDRMGYRLKGPTMNIKDTQEMISEAVSFGSIQIPNDGNPIILLADRQTIGGYPKIGEVASVDLPKLAQAKPGDLLKFQEITLEEAQRRILHREKNIKLLKQAIELKL